MTRTQLAAALAAILALPLPASAGAYIRISEIAERFGLAADVDLVTGKVVLADGANRIAVLPGGYQLLVNGRFAMLPERVGSEGGDLIVPASALAFIEQNLRPKTAAPAPAPVVASRPATVVPASAGAPEAAARVAPAKYAGTIVIDPGHGGVHEGAHGRIGVTEKDVNLHVAKIAKGLLEAHGWRVVLTRSDDRHFSPEVNADLDARVAFSSRSGADIFVSIHTNYAESASAQGYEVYCSPGRSKDAALARSINQSLRSAIDDEDRGVKTAGFRVIKRATVPAVLVEVGFVSHPPTERRLATEEYRRKLALAIVGGIERYSESYGRAR